MRLPFAIRRPWLLTRDLFVDRDRPDLERLRAIDDPEGFVWAILPHAARTFSACIALLPARSACAAAVAYLYCRSLDTYEDLVVDRDERESALLAFAARLDESEEQDTDPGPAPPIVTPDPRDHRDRCHLLLVEEHAKVDRVFRQLEAEPRRLIRSLVGDMAEGMVWASKTFAEQDGILDDEEQLARYCRSVLGHPVIFASRLARWRATGDPELPREIERDAMRVGELIQLANVTRDIEKDLERGVAYHPALGHALDEIRARRAVPGSPTLVAPIRTARREMMRMALRRAPSYRRLIRFLGPGRLSAARASGLLMLRFTDRHFRSCAIRAGLPGWSGPRRGSWLILSSLPAAWSPEWADRAMARIEERFLEAAG